MAVCAVRRHNLQVIVFAENSQSHQCLWCIGFNTTSCMLTATSTRLCGLCQCELIDKLHFNENSRLLRLHTILFYIDRRFHPAISLLQSVCILLHNLLFLSASSDYLTYHNASSLHHHASFSRLNTLIISCLNIMPSQTVLCLHPSHEEICSVQLGARLQWYSASSSLASSNYLCTVIKACCTKVLSTTIK